MDLFLVNTTYYSYNYTCMAVGYQELATYNIMNVIPFRLGGISFCVGTV